jgi:hypothetical protein
MTSVRQVEVNASVLEDNILDSLGYREYSVLVGETPLTPKPEVVHKPLKSFSDSQIRNFIDQLGGQGNPISYFGVAVSRAISEATIRSLDYWSVTRDGYQATCLPVSIEVTDSRYNVILAVLKQTSN